MSPTIDMPFCGSHAIVPENVKHFPRQSLDPYGIELMTADEFLVNSISTPATL
jgi:hypothetical protein